VADEKQKIEIRNFCLKPYEKHGPKKAGRYKHDWADLVQGISFFDSGRKQRDDAFVDAIAARVRDEFPNRADWNKRVNAPGAHERILTIIREGLVPQGV
jgi:hypothetical protein